MGIDQARGASGQDREESDEKSQSRMNSVVCFPSCEQSKGHAKVKGSGGPERGRVELWLALPVITIDSSS